MTKKNVPSNKSTKEEKVKPTKSKPKEPLKSFPIVGIGASAGGLEAIEGFFTHMPSDTNIAFIIIQHLAPKYKSIMGSLLGNYTKMKILEVKDGMKVEPTCVYLNPPNKDVAIMNSTLHLIELTESRATRLPIDYFFRSLAEDQGEKAIGVILSGTGTDGSLGIKAIKGEGGMTMVQEEKQAKYGGMPRSAIDTGLVDYILPVEKMPEELMKYVKHPYLTEAKKVIAPGEQYRNYLEKIFMLIRTKTGHDFSDYKPNTTRRRIERRMAVHKINRIADYIRYIQQNPAEVETLYKDMLIGVTNFFRDPDAFCALKEKVITSILKNLKTDAPVRIWVPGCSTGEEAYSMAMLLEESMDEMKRHFKIQIFATDLDPDAIEHARTAAFPDSIAADVSPERLKRFFIREDHTFRVKKQIREMVVFAVQNLIKDPPFSKLDLVSCRNVLIYMNSALQKKIIALFHYTVNQNGFLFLGSSEGIGTYTDLFHCVDTRWKIFKRKGAVLEKTTDLARIPTIGTIDEIKKAEEKKLISAASMSELAERLILEQYAPPFVIMNEKYDILYFHGETDRYLSPPSGEANFGILKMARPDLRYKLGAAILKAARQKKTVVTEAVQLKQDGDLRSVNLTVMPVPATTFAQGLMMVVFEEKTPFNKSVKKGTRVSRSVETDPRIKTLEQELQSTREYLQTTIEELETSNEELKSTNEELQSTNEELQSANEEMETSKEELQSTNEELETVNSELQHKVDELSRANNDLNNLLASTEIGTIFLDTKLCINRFTPSAAKVFNLIPTDIGRPISDITSNITDENFSKDAEEVLNTLNKREAEVKTREGAWYSMRMMPYRTVENVIDGVVITFTDITKIKLAAMHLQRLATVVSDANDAVAVYDLDGRITAWNKAAERMYGYTESEALTMNYAEIVPKDLRQELVGMIEQIKTGISREPMNTRRVTKDGRILDVCLTATKLVDDESNIIAVATTERDNTECMRLEAKNKKTIDELKEQLEDLQKDKGGELQEGDRLEARG